MQKMVGDLVAVRAGIMLSISVCPPIFPLALHTQIEYRPVPDMNKGLKNLAASGHGITSKNSLDI